MAIDPKPGQIYKLNNPPTYVKCIWPGAYIWYTYPDKKLIDVDINQIANLTDEDKLELL